MRIVGKAIPRIESYDKVTGFAKYTNDTQFPGMLHGWLLTSAYSHARISAIDSSKALEVTGVLTVLTGDSAYPKYCSLTYLLPAHWPSHYLYFDQTKLQ